MSKKAAKRRSKRRPAGAVYADFGFTPDEVFECDFCKIDEEDALKSQGFSLMRHFAPITQRCPVAGLIGVCVMCFEDLKVKETKKTDWYDYYYTLTPRIFDGEERSCCHRPWSRQFTPPAMTQPIDGVPIYQLQRGFSDETRLAECIRQTWERIPKPARRAMTKLWTKPAPSGPTFAKGALRIESLPNWPGRRRDAGGSCMNKGRAIRLRSPIVKALDDNGLMTLIAHELGHSFQWAVGVPRNIDLEEHVINLLSEWGFDNSDINAALERNELERLERQFRRAAR